MLCCLELFNSAAIFANRRALEDESTRKPPQIKVNEGEDQTSNQRRIRDFMNDSSRNCYSNSTDLEFEGQLITEITADDIHIQILTAILEHLFILGSDSDQIITLKDSSLRSHQFRVFHVFENHSDSRFLLKRS